MTDLEVLPHGDGASDFQISKSLAIMRQHLAIVVDDTHVQEDVRPPANDKPGGMTAEYHVQMYDVQKRMSASVSGKILTQAFPLDIDEV